MKKFIKFLIIPLALLLVVGCNAVNSGNGSKPEKEKTDEEIVTEALNNFLEAESYKVHVSELTNSVYSGSSKPYASELNYSMDIKNQTYLNGKVYGSISERKEYYESNGKWLYDYFYSYIYLGFEERSIVSYLLKGTVSSEVIDGKKVYTIVVPKDKLSGIDEIDLSAHVTTKYQAKADLTATITVKDSNVETLSWTAENLIYGEYDKTFKTYEIKCEFSEYNEITIIIPEKAKTAVPACDPTIEPC